jgi:hypothetical protein
MILIVRGNKKIIALIIGNTTKERPLNIKKMAYGLSTHRFYVGLPQELHKYAEQH